MCGRFTATFEFREIKVRWNLQTDLVFTPRYNIAPTQDVPVILGSEAGNDARVMRWGLVPAWAKDESIGNRMINARAETLAEKPSFKRLLGKRRCLIPANGFFEWRREGKRKVPVWIHLKGRDPFGFAGMWESWKKPDGAPLETFTIITCAPNELTATIHDRMPVILPPEGERGWLDPATGFDGVRELLKPYPAELMGAYDVSTVVNSPAFDRPECIEPVES